MVKLREVFRILGYLGSVLRGWLLLGGSEGGVEDGSEV